MKGISVLIAFVLVIVISIAAVTIALNIGNPAIDKSKEILVLNEGKSNIKVIDNAINQVLQEGDGSSRKITVGVTGGSYTISKNRVEFAMDTNAQIIASGVSGMEDGIYVEVTDGKIRGYVEYNFDFVGTTEFGKGLNTLLISNEGGSIKVT
ncbi:MAG: hypothetical protein PHU12_02300 [Candidatus Aenigmarchaeota archaeon]|nr:hypothetical protein [Candidatus Aenigmarchaeota archaeon]